VNYRHAFHAGNFADVVKHALLLAILRGLTAKPTPFAILDTHAGIGRYDLTAPEAHRTGEAAGGIRRVAHLTEGPLADYAARVREAGFPGFYPGSPLIARAMLRPSDRLVLVERHPEDYATLKATFARDPQVAVHRRDGFEAAIALTPFPERRGLVLIDPPFEQEGEFERIAASLAALRHRFRAAILAAWYPIKHRAPVRAFHAALAGVPDCIAGEITLRPPLDPTRLNGCGLLVANPPFGFAAAAQAILDAALPLLADPGAEASAAVTRITPE
jgi:23S rRNA (adenine2030-N6)-methyltransferase